MKMTKSELTKAVNGILEAGRDGNLIAGVFGEYDNGPQGCALGQAARANMDVNDEMRASWILKHVKAQTLVDMLHLNDNMIEAGVPLEIVAETLAAMLVESA